MPETPLRRAIPIRFSVVTAVGFLVLLAALLTAFALIRQRVYEEKLARTHAAADSTLQHFEREFADVSPLGDGELQSMRQFLNPVHLDYARQFGVTRPTSREETARLVADEQLAEIAPNTFYDVATMNYSVAAVTPPTRNLLDVIGHRFHERLDEKGLPLYRFEITSATRTTEDQDRLRRVNGNAAQNSAHEFGTTVDIHYARFQNPIVAPPPPDTLDVVEERYRDLVTTGMAELGQQHHSRLKALLGRVMLNLQEEGQLVVVYERRQPVYHLTVASADIPRPAATTSETLARTAAP